MKYPAPLPLPKDLSWDEWQQLRDAILVDCDTIIEAYKDIDAEQEFVAGSDACHKSNAIYVKKELTDKLDGSEPAYVQPAGIWEWMKVFLRQDFFLTEDNTSNFAFPNTKRVWLSLSTSKTFRFSN